MKHTLGKSLLLATLLGINSWAVLADTDASTGTTTGSAMNGSTMTDGATTSSTPAKAQPKAKATQKQQSSDNSANYSTSNTPGLNEKVTDVNDPEGLYDD